MTRTLNKRMETLEEILSINKCDCGKYWCEYFGAGVGEQGQSFTKHQLNIIYEDVCNAEKHLRELLEINKAVE